MKFPFVQRRKFKEVVQIAETRLFEQQHLARQVKDSADFYLRESRLNNSAFNLLLEKIFLFENQIDINEIHLSNLSIEEKNVAEIFSRWGSDKSTKHNYERLYSRIRRSFESSKISEPFILEIGCGGNNPIVRHSMPLNYSPLSSLYALQEVFQTGNIYGADIDRSLENNPSFSVFIVDQFQPNSFDVICDTGLKFDLIIDDGVHDIFANNLTFKSLFSLLNKNGYYVIEDVVSSLVPIWGKCLSIHGVENAEVLLNQNHENSEECAILIQKN